MPTKPHFVESYERLLDKLLEAHPLDEAMSIAVGGDYDSIGEYAADILVRRGLREHHRLVDIGCGSGRLSSALGRRFPSLCYLGTDIEPRLLDYASGRAPANFKFLLHRQLTIPADDNSVDFIVFISVFTHLLHEESFLYLLDAKRALRPGGTVFVTFLEAPLHWETFSMMVSWVGTDESPHLNMFTEQSMLKEWARRIGLELELEPSPGQSMAFFRKSLLSPIEVDEKPLSTTENEVLRAKYSDLESILAQTIAERDALAAASTRWFDAVIAITPYHSPSARASRRSDSWWTGLVRRLSGDNGKPSPLALANLARDEGKWELAVRYYRDALDVEPKNSEIWMQCGDALKRAGKTSEAGLAYQRSRELTRGRSG